MCLYVIITSTCLLDISVRLKLYLISKRSIPLTNLHLHEPKTFVEGHMDQSWLCHRHQQLYLATAKILTKLKVALCHRELWRCVDGEMSIFFGSMLCDTLSFTRTRADLTPLKKTGKSLHVKRRWVSDNSYSVDPEVYYRQAFLQASNLWFIDLSWQVWALCNSRANASLVIQLLLIEHFKKSYLLVYGMQIHHAVHCMLYMTAVLWVLYFRDAIIHWLQGYWVFTQSYSKHLMVLTGFVFLQILLPSWKDWFSRYLG